MVPLDDDIYSIPRPSRHRRAKVIITLIAATFLVVFAFTYRRAADKAVNQIDWNKVQR